MIVAMKKATLVVLSSSRRRSLSRLKELGLLHVESGHGSSGDLEKAQERESRISKALGCLGDAEASGRTNAQDGPSDLDLGEAVDVSARILAVADELKGEREAGERLRREHEKLEAWGDWDPADVRFLTERGLHVAFFALGPEHLKTFRPACATVFVRRDRRGALVVCVARDARELPSGFESLPLPEQGLSAVAAALDAHRSRLRSIEERLAAFAAFIPALNRARRELAEQVEFERVAAAMGEDSGLVHLSGFVPQPRTEALRHAAAAEGWALLLRDPAPDEQVPTLVENPAWVSIIQPVFDFLGVTPGYREVDISQFFLLFFVVFFAMIIGDAGYGVLFLGMSLFFMSKEKKTLGRASRGTILLTLLNIATIVWGALTGTWFGSTALNVHPALRWMVVPALDSFDPRSAELVKHITFVIGTLHLSLARVWNFLRDLAKRPRIRALAQLGWLSMVLGLYYFVLFFVLDAEANPIPAYALPMILGGLATVFVFGQQEGDFLKGLLSGFGNFITTFLDGISVFADIISYIRLFAVGLATVEIAKSFNSMAGGILEIGPLGILPFVLVLVTGHGLNMAMAALAVIVHGVRLNMLEFSKHLGLEWAGYPYKPFTANNLRSRQGEE